MGDCDRRRGFDEWFVQFGDEPGKWLWAESPAKAVAAADGGPASRCDSTGAARVFDMWGNEVPQRDRQ